MCNESQQHFGVVEVEDSFDPKYVEGRKCRNTYTHTHTDRRRVDQNPQ